MFLSETPLTRKKALLNLERLLDFRSIITQNVSVSTPLPYHPGIDFANRPGSF